MKKTIFIVGLITLTFGLNGCKSPSTVIESKPPVETTTPDTTKEKPPKEDLTNLLSDDQQIISMKLTSEQLLVLTAQGNEGKRSNYRLIIRELTTEKTYEVSFDSSYKDIYDIYPNSLGQIAILCSNNESQQLRCIQQDGSILWEQPVNSNFPIVDSSHNKLWYQDDSQKIKYIDMTDGHIGSFNYDTNIELRSVHAGILYGFKDQNIISYHSDTNQQKEYSNLSLDFNLSNYGGYFEPQSRFYYDDIMQMKNHCFFWDYNQEDHVYCVQAPGTFIEQGPTGSAFFYENTTTEITIQAINPYQSLFLGEISVSNSEVQNLQIGMTADNGTSLAFSILQDQSVSLYLWNYGTIPTQEYASTDISLSDLADYNQTLAAKLSEKYNIMIHAIPGKSIPGDGNVYAYDTKYSLLSTYSALLYVETILDRYPTKILQQLCADYLDGIELYFTRSLAPITSESSTTAKAVTYVYASKRIIVLSIDDIWSLPHELMHVMEDRITDSIAKQDIVIDYEKNWMQLNPKGFQYLETYRYNIDSPDMDKWVFQLDTNDNAYFLDQYSKTFALEDRARIFEQFFYHETAQLNQSSHIIKKATFLCSLIHTVFDLEEEATWEVGLEIKDMTTDFNH